MAFYAPKRSFDRSKVDDLDLSREGGIRDMVIKDGPMSNNKNK
jgi:hypothetical protein